MRPQIPTSSRVTDEDGVNLVVGERGALRDRDRDLVLGNLDAEIMWNMMCCSALDEVVSN